MKLYQICGCCVALWPVLTSSLLIGQEKPSVPLSGWKMVWNDEFDVDRLDLNKWSLCKRGQPDWKNTMSNDPRLIVITKGVLHLRGIQNDKLKEDASPYLTAGLTTRGKFSFLYGKIVIRAKFKSAQGAWPALWMMGDNGRWPANGEIDLMEHLNFDQKIYQTVHSEYTHEGHKNKPTSSKQTIIQRDEWNTYGAEWDEQQIVFTVNGRPTFSYPRIIEKGVKQYPFTQPFYLIMSMQIGGKWVNKSGATNPIHYPAGMEIDWVRVYRKKK